MSTISKKQHYALTKGCAEALGKLSASEYYALNPKKEIRKLSLCFDDINELASELKYHPFDRSYLYRVVKKYIEYHSDDYTIRWNYIHYGGTKNFDI